MTRSPDFKLHKTLMNHITYNKLYHNLKLLILNFNKNIYTGINPYLTV